MESILACYEAGACGFERHRRETDTHVAYAVVAPTSILKKSNDRIKTGRRDVVKLAIEFRNGNLSPVYVPIGRDEAVRDYPRYWQWLRSLEFDSPMDRDTFDEYLAHVGYLEEKRGRIAKRIDEIATEPHYEKSVAHLHAFCGNWPDLSGAPWSARPRSVHDDPRVKVIR